MHQPAVVPRAHAVAGAALALLLAIVVGACGAAATTGDGVVSLRDPSSPPDPSATAAPSMDPDEAMEAFTACMREHGVDIEVVTIGENGGGGTVNIGGSGGTGEGPAKGAEAQPGSGVVDVDAMAEADEACRHLLPGGRPGDPAATMDPAIADQMLEFSRCMREHGIDFPDPVFEGGGVSITLGTEGGIDPESEAFAKAQAACGEATPGGGPFVIGPAPAGTEP